MAAAIPSAFLLLLLLSSPFLVFSQSTSPSPSPTVGPLPAISAILPLSSSPMSPSPEISSSPPAPPTADESPSSAPSPSYTPSPAPSLLAIGVSRAADSVGDRDEKNSGGMSAGKKVGVAFGVIAAATLVGLGVVVYRKRQENLRRARYGINARMMEMI